MTASVVLCCRCASWMRATLRRGSGSRAGSCCGRAEDDVGGSGRAGMELRRCRAECQGDSSLSTSDFRRRAAPVAADLETLAAVVAAGATARAALTAARPAPCRATSDPLAAVRLPRASRELWVP